MLYPFGSYEVDSAGVATKFLQIGIEKVAAKKSSGETLYYQNDHLGGVNLITDSQGLKLQLVEYDPWGQPSREEGSADPTHRFTGEELDPETGLLYYGGRHYDPALARFISPDPFIPRPWDPQSLNRYSYVRNNPVNRIDPTGYEDGGSDGLGEFGGYENSGADYSADSTSDFGSSSGIFGALFGPPVDVYLEVTYTPSPPSPDNPPTTPTPTPAPQGPTNFASPSTPNHGSPGGGDPASPAPQAVSQDNFGSRFATSFNRRLRQTNAALFNPVAQAVRIGVGLTFGFGNITAGTLGTVAPLNALGAVATGQGVANITVGFTALSGALTVTVTAIATTTALEAGIIVGSAAGAFGEALGQSIFAK